MSTLNERDVNSRSPRAPASNQDTSTVGNSPLNNDPEQLAAYCAQPPEERGNVLDDVIVRFINNDDFMTLCEDIDHSWRRIGLEK